MQATELMARLKRVLFGTKKRMALTVAITLFALILLGVGSIYRYITMGGMIARQEPPALEAFVARHLVNLSIPDDAKALKNPLAATTNGADVAAGRDLYQQNCEACHGFDGGGKTSAGTGLYPPPATLRGPDTLRRTDGTLFYLIRNGIRNTGMPGWQLTDQQTWQLVLLIRHLPLVASTSPMTPNAPSPSARYVGSTACAACHQGIYDRWKTTLMANVVRDPREHPEAIIPDLSKHDPLVTFTVADIAFVYGSKWKQRYFKKAGNDYFPLPAQWDVTHKKWRPYFVKDDWWVTHYPADNFKRPTGPTCDGCHSVNYNTSTKTVTEWNVGCERCHGPGSEHVGNPISATIVNPSRLDYVQSNDTCVQCHSQGRPLANPVDRQYYDWPVGFRVGGKLSDFWKLEEHKLGDTTFTHFADGTAHKNRMQGNDFATSLMYTHGVTCFTCHDPHGSRNESMLRKPASMLCLDCHGPKSPNGPHAPTDRATHAPQGCERGQRVHRVPHAENRADAGRRECTQSYLSLCLPSKDRQLENSKCLQHLPHRQGNRMGSGRPENLG